MDHLEILKRAWAVVWRYRALWLVGLILGATTMSWAEPTLLRWRDEWDDDHISTVDIHLPNQSIIRIPGHVRIRDNQPVTTIIVNYRHRRDEWQGRPGDVIVHWNPPAEYALELVARDARGRLKSDMVTIAPQILRWLLAVSIIAAFALLVLLILSRIARYVSEAALLRMVDDHEQSGIKYGFWRGLKLGWSRSAWRIFLVNWCLNALAALAFALLFVPAFMPMALWFTRSEAVRVVGILSTLGLSLVVLALVLVAGSILSVWKRLAWRACALENLSTLKSISRGLAMVRERLKDVGLMWLLMVGLRLVWPLLMVPFVLVLLPLAGLAAGGSALALGGLAQSVWHGAAPWIAAALIGLTVFLTFLLVPLQLLGGIWEAFQSSVWTLTYRELLSAQRAVPEPIVRLAPSAAD
jgi:hypothetical protein